MPLDEDYNHAMRRGSMSFMDKKALGTNFGHESQEGLFNPDLEKTPKA
jgi:hypothetical protein